MNEDIDTVFAGDAERPRMFPRLFVLWIGLVLGAASCVADEPALTLSLGGAPLRVTAAELLARPDVTTIQIPNDVAYGRDMTFRAVPLLRLIGDKLSGFDTVETRALDGYASQISSALIKKASTGGSSAWIAIEDTSAPWPKVPGQDFSAGPFYLVWVHPERSGVGKEQWPFAVTVLTGVENPVARWPQLAVDPALPAAATERKGQGVFVTNCMPCHRFYGAGQGDVGPDLGQPMNVTQYMSEAGIRAIVRDPKAVRSWPRRQMEGLDEAAISNADLDALIAYLIHMAKRTASTAR